MPKKKCPLVFIEWEDSTQPVGKWQHLTDLDSDRTCVRCVSVGWLVIDNKKIKALAPNLGALNEPGNAQASGIITIPTRAVISLVKLKEPNLSSF